MPFRKFDFEMFCSPFKFNLLPNCIYIYFHVDEKNMAGVLQVQVVQSNVIKGVFEDDGITYACGV